MCQYCIYPKQTWIALLNCVIKTMRDRSEKRHSRIYTGGNSQDVFNNDSSVMRRYIKNQTANFN